MGEFIEPELVLDGSGPFGQQLEVQIKTLILGGILRPGEELPTIRGVAVGLAISPRSVEEAYRRLEADGFIFVDEGSGPRVASVREGAAESLAT